MVKKPDKNTARLKRHARVRKKISGTAARPRLNVFRSAKHIYAQLIDDVAGVTLASASSMEKRVRRLWRKQRSGEKRSAWPSHRKHRRKGSPKSSSTGAAIFIMGASKELAEGAREGGLKF